ncbi:lysine N(6)-hydroxylase/L-ornithine N(5)-oxygenase family protein [Haladaptatus sp. DJG-WS-42]|uniref:lysine N(6)-hydroxylase/L-ornithine N(5)-oxygenase family protein n=1 Tax=Haladaptatus sp. DJG-WS-42 TaxID=3120516 RepID=UPI0030CF3DA8
MSDDERVYDVLGVGLGPFNLGLAALIESADEDLDAVFVEQKQEFEWHGGMLIEGTTLEVPFLADLVTLADPTSRYSFLNYLRERDRLYEFYFFETFQIPRREYNAYCQWVSRELSNTQFSQAVTSVREEGDHFRVRTIDPETGDVEHYLTKNVVVGIGSRPHVPEPLQVNSPDVFHTASYLDNRERCLDADNVAVVGSGQSAAEVFLDLLEHRPDTGQRLDWFTRSPGFFPMEYSKLGLQFFTPEYSRYFHDLPQEVRDETRANQDLLYKGIDENTSADIYDELYRQSIRAEPDVGLLANTEIRDLAEAEDRFVLDCHQREQAVSFAYEADVVVLGTGYTRPEPVFLAPLEPALARDDKGRFCVSKDYQLDFDGEGGLFVQNMDLHSHGIGAPDLGLGAYRNSIIVNRLAGREVYPEDTDTVFQSFDAASFANRTQTHSPQ